ncbi:hypothetical protein SDC9_170623 [bioreactor metagenome]|uniref:Uncharacterized protein n=1 Tax=bioreactor metagenome TaxID=1076179 RepID=A0A645G9B2_9ZZZZ
MNHVINAGIPCLRRRSHLRGDLSDLAIYVVEHTGQVVHNAADQYLFQPFGNLLLDEIQTASPPFPRPHAQRKRSILLSASTEQAGEQRNQRNADQGHAAARHELLNAL